MEMILQELRRAFRTPGFSAVAVLTLALGIGATTTICAVLEHVVLDPLPYPDASRLVRIRNAVPGVGADAEWYVSPAQYLYFREHARSFEEIGVYRIGGALIAGPDGAVRASAAIATAGLLRVLGARPLVGRRLEDGDGAPGAPPVAVLAHGFWQSRFGGNPAAAGRVIDLGGIEAEVVGVLAEGTDLPEAAMTAGRFRTDVWLSYGFDPAGLHSHTLPALARLRPGTTRESARAELDALRPGLMEAYPQIYTPALLERWRSGGGGEPGVRGALLAGRGPDRQGRGAERPA